MHQIIIKKLKISETDKEIYIDKLNCDNADISKVIGMFISTANFTKHDS